MLSSPKGVNASTSVAATLLTTEAVVAIKKEPAAPAAPAMPEY